MNVLIFTQPSIFCVEDIADNTSFMSKIRIHIIIIQGQLHPFKKITKHFKGVGGKIGNVHANNAISKVFCLCVVK